MKVETFIHANTIEAAYENAPSAAKLKNFLAA
jgi:hypothetical protein